ncbi:hypothetical protein BBO99_00008098 [Phytophthora kernoviae]|uniref:Uncharacterized protein n=1 Tax=Phytophthora kernoviae TaxID=325452 RepID=A0A3R7K1K1_9STRA|nr:hypothetical protein BBI17_008015 [Phytophthora kernoviae]RLN75751.1 hypothetical protein BBO99_00008098 [Phytophthora kernoviae]
MMASKFNINSCFESGEKAALVIYYAMKRYIEADLPRRAHNVNPDMVALLQYDLTSMALKLDDFDDIDDVFKEAVALITPLTPAPS